MTDYVLRLSDEEIARYKGMAAAARASEAALWQLAGITEGAVVADVGCGPGALLPALSELAERVEAVDGDVEAVSAAQRLVDSTGLRNVSVRQGRAEATGLAQGSFDAVMMRHVLAHNGAAAQQIVRHLASLLKPGGSVLLVDVDATMIRMRPADDRIAEMQDRYHRFQTQRGSDLSIGLRLDQLLAGAELEVAAYTGMIDVVSPPPGVRTPAWAARSAMVEAGFATDEDVRRWDAAYAEREAAGTAVTAFVPRFIAVGRKPAT